MSKTNNANLPFWQAIKLLYTTGGLALQCRVVHVDEFLKWVIKRFKCVPLVGSCDNDSEDMRSLLAQATTVDAVKVVRCRNCVMRGNCSTEDAFNFAKIEDPFCCAGKERPNT